MERPQLVGFVGGLLMFLLASLLILSWGAPSATPWGRMLTLIIGILITAGVSFFARRLLIPALLGTGFVFTVASDSWWHALGDKTAAGGAVASGLIAVVLDVAGIILILAGLLLLARDVLRGKLVR
jgi:hypothetical protein